MLSTVQHLRSQSAARALHAFAEAARAFPARLFADASQSPRIASDIDALDALLSGGFPKAGLTELLPAAGARGEVDCVLGALAKLGRTVWVLPTECTYVPNGALLRARGMELSEQLFVVPSSAEEAFDTAVRAAASGEARAVIAWLPSLTTAEDFRAMRRLALASETAGIPVFVIRPAAMACTNSPAKLRLQLFRADRPNAVRVRANMESPLMPIVREAVVGLEATKTPRKQPAPAARILAAGTSQAEAVTAAVRAAAVASAANRPEKHERKFLGRPHAASPRKGPELAAAL